MEGNVSGMKNSIYESISLCSYVDSFRDEEEMREIFLNMDRAIKYLHDRGYCVGSFDPRKIEILNNSINYIRFVEILPLPSDNLERKKYIKEDIYNSSFVQIGLYSKCLLYLRQDFLKSNFDSFAKFLPEGDVPYYRGVIERGASVYFCEYAMEKAKRDYTLLEKELSLESGVKISSNGVSKSMFDDIGVNDKINDKIYKQITGKGEAAFISFLLFPTVIIVLGIIISLIAMFLNI